MTKEKFISQKTALFWDTKNPENLSDASVVEKILNYGDFDDVLELFSVYNKEKVAHIFYEQAKGKRSNYRPEIRNYYDLYFQKIGAK